MSSRLAHRLAWSTPRAIVEQITFELGSVVWWEMLCAGQPRPEWDLVLPRKTKSPKKRFLKESGK